MPWDVISFRKILVFWCGLAAVTAHAERVTLWDARTAVLGGGPAIDAGCYAVGTNPAALAELSHLQFTFEHKVFAAPDVALEALAGGVPLGSYGTLAAAFGTVRAGNVQWYSPAGRLIGEYVYHDDLLAAGYGLRATDWLALGAAANYERHLAAPGVGYDALGIDAGLYSRPLGADSSLEYAVGRVGLAVAARNVVASRREVYTGDYREPFEVSVGALWSRDVGRHSLALTFSLPLDDPVSTALGCEFVVASVLAARAGVTGTHPAGGVGVSTGIFSFDYGYVSREFGPSHYLTVSVNPGRDARGGSERRRRARELLTEGRSYFEAGNYELAAERFAAVLEWEPHDRVARQYWIRAKYHYYVDEGNAYVEKKDWPEARRAFGAALVAVPDDFLAAEYLARVDEQEEEDLARQEEEKRIAGLLARATSFRRRGAHRRALEIYEEILADHPGHAEARKLANETRRILAAASAKPTETAGPEEIPADVVSSYRSASEAFGRGDLAEAVRTLSDIVSRYPDYGDARDKLVEAYLYQGLDFFSKGSLSAAIRVWSRGLELDPGNEKLQRYIKKAEFEIDQIR
jgi:tetratricopeptide (TPR) repeat protein